MGTMTDTRRAEVMAALGTPNFANETSGDFSDLVPSTTRRRYVDLKDSVRIVKGADDLVHPNAGRPGGVARSSAPAIPYMGGHAVKSDDDDNLAPKDLRTERQVEVMSDLIRQLHDLDENLALQAVAYTARMTEHGAWTPGRGGNTSRWIGKLIAKVRELKDRPAPVMDTTAAVNTGSMVPHDALPMKADKNGKPMPLYYAVEMDGVLKFYRVKQGTKPGWWWIDAQASDDLHSVRSVATRNLILRAIIAAGPEACMARYGQEIGRCGRCDRTLTDAESRARGIGPDCAGKM